MLNPNASDGVCKLLLPLLAVASAGRPQWLGCRWAVLMALQRIPEPELMDGAEQVRAYANADFNNGDQAMVARLAELCGDDPGPRLVDLGCGPGNISLRLAERFPATRLVGIDGSAAMLQVAEQRRRACTAAGELLSLARHTLPSQALEQGPLAGRCTALVSNSLLHHLHEPAVLWRTVRALAAPGAFLYLRDLRRPASSGAAEALLALHLPEAPAVLKRDYLASLHAAFTPHEVEGQLAAAGLASLQVAPLDDRYLEVWGRLPG